MGPGQNEIDFKYSDALQAADDAATFQWVVKTVADANGLYADFSPKPLEDYPGNGMHINMSINNYDDYILPFMAGILSHMKELTLFLNPSEKSYFRFGKDKAPQYITWSYENRSQLVRIPATHASSRMELRSPDCTCNPYLAYALLIQAGLEGIEKQLEIPQAVDINLFHADPSITSLLEQLPRSLDEAKMFAKNSSWIKKYVNESILDAYTK